MLLIIAYWWACLLFGIFHVQRSRKTKGYFNGGDWEAPAAFFCVLVVWWYWPVILINFLVDRKEKEAKDLEALRNKR